MRISDASAISYVESFMGFIEGTRQNPVTHKKEVGMFEKWTLIRSHIGRRSFATNYYNVLSNKVIMAVTIFL